MSWLNATRRFDRDSSSNRYDTWRAFVVDDGKAPSMARWPFFHSQNLTRSIVDMWSPKRHGKHGTKSSFCDASHYLSYTLSTSITLSCPRNHGGFTQGRKEQCHPRCRLSWGVRESHSGLRPRSGLARGSPPSPLRPELGWAPRAPRCSRGSWAPSCRPGLPDSPEPPEPPRAPGECACACSS